MGRPTDELEDENTQSEYDYGYDDTLDDDEDYESEDDGIEYDDEEIEELDGHLNYVDPADFEE